MKQFAALAALILGIESGVAYGVCPSAQAGEAVAVPSEAVAVALAKPALAKAFSREEITKYEPFRAELQGSKWRIYGYLPPDVVGGTPEAEVCKLTGQIVRVYLTQ